MKNKKQNHNTIFSFNTNNGVVNIFENKVIFSWISRNGCLHLKTTNSNQFHYHKNIIFLRGLEYFFFSLFFYFEKILPATNSNLLYIKKHKKLLFCISLITFLLIVFIPKIILNTFTINDTIYRLLLIILRIFLLISVINFLCFITPFSLFFKFHYANTKTLKEKEYVDFFNVIFYTCTLWLFMVSLFAIEGSLIIKICVWFVIFLISIALSYEFQILTKLNLPMIFTTSISNTEKIIVTGAYIEGECMKNHLEENVIDNFAMPFVIAEIKTTLAQNNINDFGETEWLIANVLKCKKLDLRLIQSISLSQYKEIKKALARRIKKEPIDSIFGSTEFFGLKFKTNKNVLTPRQETEILVEEVIKNVNPKCSILDIGTGSGAISIAIAKNCKANIIAVDISEPALKIAKENAKINNVDIKFVQSDLFSNLKNKKFDIIVSNPPYIKTNDICKLDVEVKNFDPILALDGGSDGLDFYKRIIASSPQHLKKNGKIFFEVGLNQATKVKKLLTGNFDCIKIQKDYNGIQRIVSARKKDKNVIRNNKKI